MTAYTLYVTDYPAESRGAVLRAVRQCRAALESERLTLRQVMEDVSLFDTDGDVIFIGTTGDEDIAGQIQQELAGLGCDLETVVTDAPEPEAVPEAEAAEAAGENGAGTVQIDRDHTVMRAGQIAAVLLTVGKGDVQTALNACRWLHMATYDDIYVAAQRFLLVTYMGAEAVAAMDGVNGG